MKIIKAIISYKFKGEPNYKCNECYNSYSACFIMLDVSRYNPCTLINLFKLLSSSPRPRFFQYNGYYFFMGHPG